jgi:hypothetical protein
LDGTVIGFYFALVFTALLTYTWIRAVRWAFYIDQAGERRFREGLDNILKTPPQTTVTQKSHKLPCIFCSAESVDGKYCAAHRSES